MTVGKTRISPAWAIWTGLAFSFPVAALLEIGQLSEGELSPVVVVPVALLTLTALAGIFRASHEDKIAFTLSVTAVVLAHLVALYSLLGASDFQKVTQYAAVLGFFGIVTGAAFYHERAIQHVEFGFFGIGLAAVLLLMSGPGQYSADRLSFADNNPIWMARDIGLLGLASFALFLRYPRARLILIGFGLVSIVGIVLTGSRGPLLALVVAVVAGGLLFRYQNKHLLIGAGLLAALIVGILLYQSGLLGSVRGLSFGGESDETEAIRKDLFAYAWYLIRQSPGGVGIGRYSYYWFTYPHNIFLEVGAEWGLRFGLFFLIWIGAGVVGILQAPQKYNLLKILVIYEALNASISGNITSPRYLYGLAFFGSALLMKRWVFGFFKKRSISISEGRLPKPY